MIACALARTTGQNESPRHWRPRRCVRGSARGDQVRRGGGVSPHEFRWSRDRVEPGTSFVGRRRPAQNYEARFYRLTPWISVAWIDRGRRPRGGDLYVAHTCDGKLDVERKTLRGMRRAVEREIARIINEADLADRRDRLRLRWRERDPK